MEHLLEVLELTLLVLFLQHQGEQKQLHYQVELLQLTVKTQAMDLL